MSEGVWVGAGVAGVAGVAGSQEPELKFHRPLFAHISITKRRTSAR